MIDLHSHILPGLDDGARDLNDALEIARAAAAEGTRVIAATPHVREDYPTRPGDMQRALAEVRAAVAESEIDIDVVSGGEIALDHLDLLSAEDRRSFGLGGNPAYLLLETPYSGWPLPFAEIVFKLVASGVTPVIGHPERNAEAQSDTSRVAELVEAGALVQITAASLDGRLGARTRSCARHLLDEDLVHLIGSDAHSAEVRQVGMSAARDSVGDERLARWLTEDVPAAIVNDQPLPIRPPRVRRDGLLARLLGR